MQRVAWVVPVGVWLLVLTPATGAHTWWDTPPRHELYSSGLCTARELRAGSAAQCAMLTRQLRLWWVNSRGEWPSATGFQPVS